MYTYAYSGPVLMFDRPIANDWYAETSAPTEAKARSNFKYRFKKEFGYERSARIELPGKIKLIGGSYRGRV